MVLELRSRSRDGYSYEMSPGDQSALAYLLVTALGVDDVARRLLSEDIRRLQDRLAFEDGCG